MINRPPFKQLKTAENNISPGVQFIIFTAIGIGILIVCNILVLAFYGFKGTADIISLKPSTPHLVVSLWVIQFLGTTLPILAAPVLFAFVIVREPRNYIKPGFRFPWQLLLVVFAIMFISNPVIEFLSNLNQKMVLPPWLKWMRESEDSAEKLMGVMLDMKTIWSLFFNVLFIGLLTAVVEEIMFRGVLQTIFTRWTKSAHAAVWITAILFSAFHMEFFGFLPRLLLGVLFGYFVVWSGSIWPAVWGHFLNNATAVVATYLFQHKLIKANPDDQHLFAAGGYIFSFAIMLLLLFIYRKITIDKTKTVSDVNGEELG
jgi:uncharacterized protein